MLNYIIKGLRKMSNVDLVSQLHTVNEVKILGKLSTVNDCVQFSLLIVQYFHFLKSIKKLKY